MASGSIGSGYVQSAHPRGIVKVSLHYKAHWFVPCARHQICAEQSVIAL